MVARGQPRWLDQPEPPLGGGIGSCHKRGVGRWLVARDGSGANADRALERHRLVPRTESQRGRGEQSSDSCRREVGNRRMGGRRYRGVEWVPDAGRALERHQLGRRTDAQPHSGEQFPHRRDAGAGYHEDVGRGL